MKLLRWLLPFCLVITTVGCNHGVETDLLAVEQNKQAIVNGRIVTGDEHLATLMLAYRTAEKYGESYVGLYGEHVSLCSSTLITPSFVLTAAHCICSKDGDVEGKRKGIYAYLAQSLADIRSEYEIEAFYPHPDYICNGANSDLDADIALIQLKTPVPLKDVRPIAPLPPSLKIKVDEVDSKDGVTVVDVGVGITKNDVDPKNAKHEMVSRLFAYCSVLNGKSKRCAEKLPTPYEDESGKSVILDFSLSDGFMFTRSGQGTHSSICSGDSGGSMYIWRDGIPYIAGVHSHTSTPNCDPDSVSGSTIVTDYYEFIRSIVTDLPNDKPETDCADHKDNNGDGRIDCDDPWCFHVPVCLPEICDDNKDNNGDGKVDCEDEACKTLLICQTEVCNDTVDNNEDGKVDCEDVQCMHVDICQPEICDDKKDNNNDGKLDCDDEQCRDEVVCQLEVCDDKIDNNGDGLADCADPKCLGDAHCSAVVCDCSDVQCKHADCIEICDDKIDNNGDGKVDCEDARCASAVQCSQEICDDLVDNNGDGIIDCDDPACSSLMHCIAEICDDKMDNNGDGKVDCEDPTCSVRYVCNPYAPDAESSDSDSGCSVVVRKSSTSQGWAWLCAVLGLLGVRRRRV